MTTAVAEPPATAATCTHCGLPIVAGDREFVSPAPFCCAGCRTAWQVINAAGLGAYYASAERRRAAVAPSVRRYDEFDHPTFRRLYVREISGGVLETELYLEEVHCASCVWLVERVPLIVPGAIRAELNVRRSLATIQWNPAETSLAKIARCLEQLGYPSHPFRGGRADRRRQSEDRSMLVRIGVAGAIAINVMTVALALYAGWFGAMEAGYVRYFRWISLALTIPAIAGPGRLFFTSAWGAIRARRLHMDVPIAIALGAGFLRGAVNTVTDTGPIYFDGVVTLIFLLLVGRFLQQRAQRAAADSAELLHGLTPAAARLVTGHTAATVPIESLLPGAVVEVRAGETIPTDGIVTTGHSTIDLSLLTGESVPVTAGEGSVVYAGTTNAGANLHIRVTEAGESTRLGRILGELEAGRGRRAPIVHTADRLAGWFVAVVLGLAVVTYAAWRQINPEVALDHAIALLIVTCPCALALATPLTVTVAIGRAAKSGILIRGADALEVLARPATMLLDKTGTLTEGRLDLTTWAGDESVKPAVKSLEAHSHHPVARAFERAWPGVAAPAATGVEQTLGGGVAGIVAGVETRIGTPGFVLASSIDPHKLAGSIPAHLTPVLIAQGGLVRAAAGFGDPVRADSRAVLAELERAGWRIGILSGDSPSVVAGTAEALGVPPDQAEGGLSPEAKVAAVERRLEGGPVVMVGDGVNDAPAIGRASVGIGVKGGAEACLAAADVFLAKPGLGPLLALVTGAQRTLRAIRRNIVISIGYNMVGATLAMTGVINPLIAAIMMPVSSLTVTVLAWRSETFEEGR